jgi:hypothetical protein
MGTTLSTQGVYKRGLRGKGEESEYLCLSLKQRKWKNKTKMAFFKRSRFIHLFLCCDFLILIKQMHCTAFGTTKYCDLCFFFI